MNDHFPIEIITTSLILFKRRHVFRIYQSTFWNRPHLLLSIAKLQMQLAESDYCNRQLDGSWGLQGFIRVTRYTNGMVICCGKRQTLRVWKKPQQRFPVSQWGTAFPRKKSFRAAFQNWLECFIRQTTFKSMKLYKERDWVGVTKLFIALFYFHLTVCVLAKVIKLVSTAKR